MSGASVVTTLRPAMGPHILEIAQGIAERIMESRRAAAGMAIVAVLVMLALLAPWIATNDPIEQHRGQYLQAPSLQYPLGTDDLGRCIFARLLYGTRISLLIGITVVSITAIIGTALGLISGFAGGIADEAIMRLVDILLAFPGLILALVIAGLLGPGLFNVMLALAVVGWSGYARIVRACVLSEKEMGFVEATRALGGSRRYIMLRHILPQVLPPVIVMATLGMGGTILSSSALGFLGLGAQPPAPEWGSMLNEGRTFLQLAPHCTIFPGMAIMITVLAFNLLGDGLRDVMDPRQKKKKNKLEI